MTLVKRKIPDKIVLVIIGLIILVVILAIEQFPKRAMLLIPENMLSCSCSVERESIDGAEKIYLTDAQKRALIDKLGEVLIVRRGFSEGKIGPYDKFVYKINFEDEQFIQRKKNSFECKVDDHGKIYTQQSGYKIIGDFSDLLIFLDELF